MASLAVPTLLVACTALTILQGSGCGAAELSAVDKEFLDAHNAHRRGANPAAANMLEMVWDDKLATTAKAYAAKCVWAHNKKRGMNVGENLAAGTSSRYTATGAVNQWDEEKNFYSFNTGKCRPGKICGHYTQILWAKTYKLGCALQKCNTIKGLGWGGTIVVCNYSPSGNWRGQSFYEAGAACSKCPAGFKTCNKGLCSAASGPAPGPQPQTTPQPPPVVAPTTAAPVPTTPKCEAGSASPTGHAPCTDCAKGYFSPATGAMSCTQCPFGLTTKASGSKSASECVSSSSARTIKLASPVDGTLRDAPFKWPADQVRLVQWTWSSDLDADKMVELVLAGGGQESPLTTAPVTSGVAKVSLPTAAGTSDKYQIVLKVDLGASRSLVSTSIPFNIVDAQARANASTVLDIDLSPTLFPLGSIARSRLASSVADDVRAALGAAVAPSCVAVEILDTTSQIDSLRQSDIHTRQVTSGDIIQAKVSIYDDSTSTDSPSDLVQELEQQAQDPASVLMSQQTTQLVTGAGPEQPPSGDKSTHDDDGMPAYTVGLITSLVVISAIALVGAVLFWRRRQFRQGAGARTQLEQLPPSAHPAPSAPSLDEL